MFGTKLLETVELTLCVMLLLRQLLPFHNEIPVLIRLGCIDRRVRMVTVKDNTLALW